MGTARDLHVGRIGVMKAFACWNREDVPQGDKHSSSPSLPREYVYKFTQPTQGRVPTSKLNHLNVLVKYNNVDQVITDFTSDN